MTTLTVCLDRINGAVWDYIDYQHWVLIASDGEILVELKGEHPSGIYGYKGKRYASATHAKSAAMLDLRTIEGKP